MFGLRGVREMKKNAVRLTKEQRELVERNLGLVAYMMAKHDNYGLDRDDAYQIGCLGLMKAAVYYDSTRGVKFSTFAARCIRNQALMAVRKEKKHRETLSLDVPLMDGRKMMHIDALPDMGPSIEETVETAQGFCALCVLLKHTDGANMDAVCEYLLGSESQFRVGKAHGISQSAMSRSVRQAIQALGAQMRREDWGL